MSGSILRQLVVKDLTIMKRPAIGYLVGGIAAVLFATLMGPSRWVYWLFGQILFVSALFGAGVHASMRTIVEERRERNLAFVMSLPITILGYTKAKIVANLTLLGGIWLALSVVSYTVFPRGLLPNGAIPFVTVFLLLVFLAYTVILCSALVFHSHGAAVVSVVGTNLTAALLMWLFVDLSGVRSTVGGDTVVWNGTYLTTLGVELAAIVGLIAATLYVQSRKTEFV